MSMVVPIGCSSLHVVLLQPRRRPSEREPRDDGRYAAALWRRARERHRAPAAASPPVAVAVQRPFAPFRLLQIRQDLRVPARRHGRGAAVGRGGAGGRGGRRGERGPAGVRAGADAVRRVPPAARAPALRAAHPDPARNLRQHLLVHHPEAQGDAQVLHLLLPDGARARRHARALQRPATAVACAAHRLRAARPDRLAVQADDDVRLHGERLQRVAHHRRHGRALHRRLPPAARRLHVQLASRASRRRRHLHPHAAAQPSLHLDGRRDDGAATRPARVDVRLGGSVRLVDAARLAVARHAHLLAPALRLHRGAQRPHHPPGINHAYL